MADPVPTFRKAKVEDADVTAALQQALAATGRRRKSEVIVVAIESRVFSWRTSA